MKRESEKNCTEPQSDAKMPLKRLATGGRQDWEPTMTTNLNNGAPPTKDTKGVTKMLDKLAY